MAPLPKAFDPKAFWLRQKLLQGGASQEVLAEAKAILARGADRPEIQRIVDELSSRKRGRPATGAKYRWIEIGERNEDLRDKGEKYEVRLDILSKEFGVKDLSKIKTILAKYKRAMDEHAEIEREG